MFYIGGNNLEQTSKSSTDSHKTNTPESLNEKLSKELSERMRKRRCFADKDLEEIDPNNTHHQQHVQTRLIQEEQEESLSEKKKKLELNNDVTAKQPESINLVDSLGKFLAYYSHFANLNHYNHQLNMLNSSPQFNIFDIYSKFLTQFFI